MKLGHAGGARPGRLVSEQWAERQGGAQPPRPRREPPEAVCVTPGKANTPPDASLSQIESEKITGGNSCAR